MNVLKLFLAFTIIGADLIGYNRLGNNVHSHLKGGFQKRSQSSYLRQLQQFMDTQDNSQAEKLTKYIDSNIKEAAPKRRTTRRSLYFKNMRRQH